MVITVGEKNRKIPSHVCAGRIRRSGGNEHNWGGGHVWITSKYHTSAVLGSGRHYGCQSIWPSMGYSAEFVDGMGPDAPDLYSARRRIVMAARQWF